MTVYPTKLKLTDPAHLRVDWSDGQVRTYAVKQLRDQCPCATCREQRTQDEPHPDPLQLTVISPQEARPLEIVTMKPVGNYAYSIAFSDGHDSGIFSFELLLELGEPARE